MDTKIKIDNILSNNKIIDLENFLEKRSCINTYNQWLSYIFYLFQAVGVFLVSIGNAYKNDYSIWTGVGLNSLASFIYIIINSNHKISSSLYNNIQKIKNGNYVDEEDLDAIDKNSNSSGNLTPKNIRQLSSYI
jgi:hypothetical protein